MLRKKELEYVMSYEQVLTEVFPKFPEVKAAIKDKYGLIIVLPGFDVTYDTTKFYLRLMHMIYPGCSVEDCQLIGISDPGRPDFKVTRADGSHFWVEVKSNNDSLNKNQLKWIFANINDGTEEIKVMFVTGGRHQVEET